MAARLRQGWSPATPRRLQRVRGTTWRRRRPRAPQPAKTDWWTHGATPTEPRSATPNTAGRCYPARRGTAGDTRCRVPRTKDQITEAVRPAVPRNYATIDPDIITRWWSPGGRLFPRCYCGRAWRSMCYRRKDATRDMRREGIIKKKCSPRENAEKTYWDGYRRWIRTSRKNCDKETGLWPA